MTGPSTSPPISGEGAFRTSGGTNEGAFGPTEWVLLFTVAAVWGSSFLWIAIGLEGFHPGAVALLRVVLGAMALAFLPTARRTIARADRPSLSVVALAGNAAPAVFFALAEQRVESSVAGMLNAASPLLVLLIAVLLTRRLPARQQVVGLAVGFVGAVLMAGPNVVGAEAEPLGVFFVFCAILGYSVSNNVVPPLQQTYGGPAVMLNALVVSSIVLAPYGIYGLARSDPGLRSILAVVILGIAGTGMARAMYATLTGRVGAPRSAIMGYLVPVMAIVLGVVVLDESIHPAELAGTAIVLLGAWIVSRRPTPAPSLTPARTPQSDRRSP